MEHVDLFQVISQVFALIGAKDAHGQAYEGPQVHHRVVAPIVFAQFMDLGMAVVAPGNAVVCTGGLDLIIFYSAVLQAFLLETGLEESAPAAAAVVVGAVGNHVDEILFTHHRFDHEPEILGNGIAVGLADYLAGILYREFDPQILVPVGIDLQFAFADPFGVVFINVFDFKVVFKIEFFQSCQD